MSLSIRPLTFADRPEVARIAGYIVQRAYFALDGYPRDPEYDLALGDVASRMLDAVVVVALLDEAVVGCLTYVDGPDNPHHEFDDADAASFRCFGVDPGVQGQGVGEAMVRWCIARARADGRRRLRIHTLVSMPGAQRLYERLGFRRDPGFDEDWDGIEGLAFVLDV